ncbi:MAG: outer membrane protein assembly factor BamA [Bacteroidales bacterium]|nr:outer membrane protein assembly factor BamA [Bacteroidales bacterium]
MPRNSFFLILLLIFLSWMPVSGQFTLGSKNTSLSYETPKEYEIGGITVSGVKYLDQDVLIQITGLTVGEKLRVPGEKLTDAVKKLWNQGLFSDVVLSATKIQGDLIFLNFHFQERPRLSKFKFTGVKKHEADELKDDYVKLVKGGQVTDNLINSTIYAIKNYYIDKGYYFCDVSIIQTDDTTLLNNVILDIVIDTKKRSRISTIDIDGNQVLTDFKFKWAMKETKENRWYNLFKPSKYIESNIKEDKNSILAKYNSLGYRDAKILKDSMYVNPDSLLTLYMKVEEGNQYFFRNISWSGNTKYTNEALSQILDIKKGDIYDQSLLDEKIYMEERGIFSLYQDNGYLFSSVTPVEIQVENDSIDIEMQIYEGKQATINKIIISGNTKTNEHVIRREIRTQPGQLYNRSDIIRTHRELAQLGYFNPENIGVNPVPNPMDGTVDIEYTLEEKPSDQIELSGGWGYGQIVGTFGLKFSNFSTKNMFKKSAWSPLPSGDGQQLSLRAQSNGLYYQSYNMSFVEPWLGGKKPTTFTVSIYNTLSSDGSESDDPDRKFISTTGAAIGLGKRLKWPDDFFILYNELSYQHYELSQWSYFIFEDGIANNLNISTEISRNSVDQNIYPRRGSTFSLKLQITPPYSLINGKDYASLEDAEKFKWIEYHKWSFKASWFSRIVGDLVLNTKINYGFLGYYNKDARSPFEGYYMGGDGLSGYSYYGRETIAMRGYDNGSMTPEAGGNIYNKYTLELRYPISLNPQATFYALAFLEGGNCWYDFRDFNPFEIKRSAGVGMRIFLPMFGMLGVDWGYGFDDLPESPGSNGSQFHFVIGQQY